MARNDLDAVLATITEDVMLLSAAGPPVVGREAVRQVYSAMIEKFTMQNTAEHRFCLGSDRRREDLLSN